MTTWFRKSTGWYGAGGRAHILARRDGDDWLADWIAACGLRADMVEITTNWEDEHRAWNACRSCAPEPQEPDHPADSDGPSVIVAV